MQTDARVFRAPPALASPMVRQWERQLRPQWLLRLYDTWTRYASAIRLGGRLALMGAAVGTAIAIPGMLRSWTRMHEEVRLARDFAAARAGELTLLEFEMQRLERIFEHAKKHDIPVDLASRIHDIALEEGVDPELAFSLVRVESNFTHDAVSSAGAVGLTQVMPSTAAWLQPGVGIRDLFDGDTNLRLGFRYLRQLLAQFDGDLRLALLAYNRGPTRVDSIRSAGGDPANGYAASVMRGINRATNGGRLTTGDR